METKARWINASLITLLLYGLTYFLVSANQEYNNNFSGKMITDISDRIEKIHTKIQSISNLNMIWDYPSFFNIVNIQDNFSLTKIPYPNNTGISYPIKTNYGKRYLNVNLNYYTRNYQILKNATDLKFNYQLEITDAISINEKNLRSLMNIDNNNNFYFNKILTLHSGKKLIIIGYTPKPTMYQVIYQTSMQDFLFTFIYLATLFICSNILISSINVMYARIDKLKQDAQSDPLTKAKNRKYLENYRFTNRTTIAVIDIDNLKVINDTYGHREGDKILADFVAIATNNMRDNDQVIRMGGDEFIIISNNTTPIKLKKAIERISKRITFNFSYGITTYDTALSLDDNIHHADKMMYCKKIKKKGISTTEDVIISIN